MKLPNGRFWCQRCDMNLIGRAERCQVCGYYQPVPKRRLTTDEIIERARREHGDP